MGSADASSLNLPKHGYSSCLYMGLADASYLDLAKYSSKSLRESRVPSCFVHFGRQPSITQPRTQMEKPIVAPRACARAGFHNVGSILGGIANYILNPDEKV